MLNSKSYLLQRGTAIPSNADVNDYKTPGNYYCDLNTTAETLTNSPFNVAFTLKVEYATGTAQARQIYTRYDNGNKALRKSNGTEWGPFYYFSDDATLTSKSYLLQGGTAITSNSDMDDYTEIGNYYCNQATLSQTLKNKPTGFNSAFTMKVEFASGTGFRAQIYKDYANGDIAYRYLNGTVWSSYRYLHTTTT